MSSTDRPHGCRGGLWITWGDHARTCLMLSDMEPEPSAFNRSEALEAGISTARLRGPGFRRLYRGIYVDATTPADTAFRARAALRYTAPDGFISHHTAALIWGGVPPSTPDVHISRRRKRRSVRRGLMVHLASRAARTTTFRRMPISTPEQSFLDVAASGANLVELVVLGDSLVRAKRTTPERLLKAAAESRGYRSRAARRAARYVRAGVDSVMESLMRMLIVLAGLPEPTVNFTLRGETGDWERRFDTYYREYKLLVEYDGRQHAEDPAQWEEDIYRREELERLGFRLLIITSRGIYREPLRTLERVRAALIEAGATGIPTTFNDDWRRYFG
ncbi:DUF559 domain-containing protein [Microlunatus elymi]|uniref:DUF559 domain-containing protein n=1 Tax=Microlunatus elymi TaxID=2596828 RepID=A0A516PZY8_9ACTN|nr:DUF559 domain-containing protein [Microlunatus elymi]QDP96746.1 DUF559 domain-containing protein [Microlunatus elymi]